MSTLEWVGILVGTIGAVSGFGGVYVAFLAYRKASESNKTSVEALEVSRRSLVHEEELAKETRTARLIHLEGERQPIRLFRPLIGIAERMRGHQIGIRVLNEGPDVARDVYLSITRPDGTVAKSKRQTVIERNTEGFVDLPLYKADFEFSDPRDFRFRVDWRDGNGSHWFEFSVRIHGAWEYQWESEKLVADKEQLNA